MEGVWPLRALQALLACVFDDPNQEGGLLSRTNRVGCLSDLFSDFTANKCVLC